MGKKYRKSKVSKFLDIIVGVAIVGGVVSNVIDQNYVAAVWALLAGTWFVLTVLQDRLLNSYRGLTDSLMELLDELQESSNRMFNDLVRLQIALEKKLKAQKAQKAQKEKSNVNANAKHNRKK